MPFEETETKPLEIGNLLDNESLKTPEGLAEIAEGFAGCDEPPLDLNDLLDSSLLELKEKVSGLPSNYLCLQPRSERKL